MVCIWVLTAHTPEEYLACCFDNSAEVKGNVKFPPKTKTRSNFSFRASASGINIKTREARPGLSVPSSGPEVSESVIAGSRAVKWHPVPVFDANMCRRMKCEVVKMHLSSVASPQSKCDASQAKHLVGKLSSLGSPQVRWGSLGKFTEEQVPSTKEKLKTFQFQQHNLHTQGQKW